MVRRPTPCPDHKHVRPSDIQFHVTYRTTAVITSTLKQHEPSMQVCIYKTYLMKSGRVTGRLTHPSCVSTFFRSERRDAILREVITFFLQIIHDCPPISLDCAQFLKSKQRH